MRNLGFQGDFGSSEWSESSGYQNAADADNANASSGSSPWETGAESDDNPAPPANPETSPVTVTQNSLAASAQVEEYQNALASQRLTRINATNVKQQTIQGLLKLINAHNTMVNMFLSQCAQTYPTMQGMTLQQALVQVQQNQPLQAMWLQYQPQLAQIDSQIAALFQNYSGAYLTEQQAEFNEFQILDSYTNFAQSVPSPVPTTQSVAATLPSVKASSIAQDSQLVTEVVGMDLIDYNAQAVVTAIATNLIYGTHSTQPRPTDCQVYENQLAATYPYIRDPAPNNLKKSLANRGLHQQFTSNYTAETSDDPTSATLPVVSDSSTIVSNVAQTGVTPSGAQVAPAPAAATSDASSSPIVASSPQAAAASTAVSDGSQDVTSTAPAVSPIVAAATAPLPVAPPPAHYNQTTGLSPIAILGFGGLLAYLMLS
jgi:hypothetical protein